MMKIHEDVHVMLITNRQVNRQCTYSTNCGKLTTWSVSYYILTCMDASIIANDHS